ncbi:hypothetical protein BDA96_03G401800 [Sorghum bicolor]|uniref:Uncharacterized protein n=1 Tax=Sorghum bicolor TaxID=4558 RepID=A0A921UQ08_SORBI|nr:hypothetical protein BDA96_03G401800 [Sorghum bicolor]
MTRTNREMVQIFCGFAYWSLVFGFSLADMPSEFSLWSSRTSFPSRFRPRVLLRTGPWCSGFRRRSQSSHFGPPVLVFFTI